MSEGQIDPAWQKVTITVEDPDGTAVVTTFPRVVGFTLAKLSAFAAPELSADDGPLVPQVKHWTDFVASGRALPNSVGTLYSAELGEPAVAGG